VKYYTIYGLGNIGATFKTGLNFSSSFDLLSKYVWSEACAGEKGYCFAKADIFSMLNLGDKIRAVTLPTRYCGHLSEGIHGLNCADSVIFGEEEKITTETIRRLIQEGADVQKYFIKVLSWSAQQGDLDLVKFIMGFRPDEKTSIDRAFHYASHYGHLDIVKYFIQEGADVLSDGYFALYWAAGHGRLNVVEYLLSLNPGTEENLSCALKVAVERDHSEVVMYLLKHGAIPFSPEPKEESK
jgi:hypothetical protein